MNKETQLTDVTGVLPGKGKQSLMYVGLNAVKLLNSFKMQRYQHYMGAYRRYRLSGPTPDIPNQNLHFSKILPVGSNVHQSLGTLP